MPLNYLTAEEFIIKKNKNDFALLDSRSESEYHHAHIPGSINIPLLKDEERKIVGTIYRAKGRNEAVKKGFELVGPRFHEILAETEATTPSKNLLLYCWRGGMRSGIISWLLNLSGFNVFVLKGGYKSFRLWALDQFQKPRNVIVLGGRTGSGKTNILQQMCMQGEQIIDLEKLANHKGSAFGHLGQNPQPSNEQFENMLAIEWFNTDPEKRLWLENESRAIGSCILPAGIYELIRNADVVDIDIGKQARIKRITSEYGCFPHEVLSEVTFKIRKRMGPQHLKIALDQLNAGDFSGWLEKVMEYYDKQYDYGNTLRRSDSIHQLSLSGLEEKEFAERIIAFASKIENKKQIIS
jgi:tRNA 2-selenouridine synthase